LFHGGIEMVNPAPIFEQVYRDYLRRLTQLDFPTLANKIGVETKDDALIIPFFGQPYKVSPSGIVDASGKEPLHSLKVLFCQYLLLYPAAEPQGQDWVSYKDFREAAPFVDGFQNNTEKAIAKNFSGKLGDLRRASLQLEGRDPGFDWNYQLLMRFDPLPHVPLILLFNDADEEFPAQGLLLFERRARKYLDMECLAILAWLLTDLLIQSGGKQKRTIM